jgi:hypothetical protein
MSNLITPDSTRSLVPGPCGVSLKLHEDENIEINSTVNEYTKEKEAEREINPEWGRNFKGFLYTDRSILS